MKSRTLELPSGELISGMLVEVGLKFCCFQRKEAITVREQELKREVMEKYHTLKSALKSLSLFVDVTDFRSGLWYQKARANMSLKLFLQIIYMHDVYVLL